MRNENENENKKTNNKCLLSLPELLKDPKQKNKNEKVCGAMVLCLATRPIFRLGG